MTKNVFLFPGQGAQYPGMGLDLWEISPAVRDLFALASDVTGADMKGLLASADKEALRRADLAQPALTLVSLAAAVCLRERGIGADGAAGFSLGEYAALAAAGAVDRADCFRLVKERGRAMQAASERARDGGMAAVIGLDPQTVAALLAEWNIPELFAANFNSKSQTAVSGTGSALAKAEALFKKNGARRFVRLAVGGAFHSPLMQSAADDFAPFLEGVSFNDPHIPLYSNVTGARVNNGAEAKRLALLQITSPVRWTEESAAVIADGFGAAFEAGPGSVLAGLWKDSGVPCYAAGTAHDITALEELFQRR